MTRVSTNGNYQSALLNLMQAQRAQNEAGERVASQKNATDLTGFGRGSETLTALKGAEARVQGFLDTGEAVIARLNAQDLAMTQMGDALTGAREAVGNALAAESVSTLMIDLEGQFQSVLNGLNFRHQGGYLFAGANTTKQPVSVSNLSELVDPAKVPYFHNDQIAAVSRVAESTTVETGFLADGFTFREIVQDPGPPPVDVEVDTNILDVFADIKAFADAQALVDPNWQTKKPTSDMKAFLTAQLSRLDKATTAMIDATSRNGALTQRVEQTTVSHKAQQLSLQELVASRTDADPLKAVTELQLSQVAVQASAQVVAQLSEVSLLNLLR